MSLSGQSLGTVSVGADTAGQWLDMEGRVVRSRGGLAVVAHLLQDDDVLEYQQRPVAAYLYTLQAKNSRQPYGYARVAKSLGPLEQKLNRSLASLVFIGIMLLVGSSWVSWWWTARALRPIAEAYFRSRNKPDARTLIPPVLKVD